MKTSLLAVLPLSLLVLGAAAAPQKKAPATAKPAAAGPFERDVLPLVQKYCLSCHKTPSPAGGVNLSTAKTLTAVLASRTAWEHAMGAVAERRMPPQGMPQPTDAERNKLAHTLEALFSQADCQLNDPGRVTMRRLNRAEYNNTVRDLFGVELRLADAFPSDDVGYGFDNIGDVLSISPLLMEKYLAAAERAARAVVIAPEDKPAAVKVSGALLKGKEGGSAYEGIYMLSSTGDAGFEFDFPAAGEYEIVVTAGAQQAGPDPAKMAILLGDQRVKDGIDVRAGERNPQPYTTKVAIDKPGKQRVAVAFLNDYYNNTSNDPKVRGDRNLLIVAIEVKIPEAARQVARNLPPAHRRLMVDAPKDDSEGEWDRAAKTILTPVARRAFRRPVTPAELARLVKITRLAKDQKQSFEKGVQLGLQAVLVSPNFLFRPELDAKPNDPKARRELNDYELATRLSYFIWSSMPDDTLLSLADQGKLKNPQVLVAQAKRMLKDPRSKALAENFAGQWLQLRSVGVVQPDTGRFPEFNEGLRQAMRSEAELFFTGVVQEDRSILEFLDADYTYMNETLARFYGNTEVEGKEFRKVPLRGKSRGGVLSMAAVLTLTSNPGRTSPVKRGKWVMENFLGTPPPPPPPNVPLLDQPGKPIEAETLRKRLEVHRTNPACANCHAQMDAIGLALENYDGIGKWRDTDNGKEIDTTGTLPDGSKFDGPKSLKQLLLSRKQAFAKTMTGRLLTFALGRGLERYDRCNLDSMAEAVEKNNYSFSAVVTAVVTSAPFRERRGDESGIKTSQVSR